MIKVFILTIMMQKPLFFQAPGWLFPACENRSKKRAIAPTNPARQFWSQIPRFCAPLTAVLALLISAGSAANSADSFEVHKFKESDKRYLQLGYERINELTQRHFGSQLQMSTAHDLPLLQRLLDTKAVKADDRRLLQDMGIVLGQLLEREFELRWVVYEDKYGPSRALQLTRTNNTLFPITMISRRAEAGLAVDVQALYDKAANRIAAYKDAIRRSYY